MNDQHRSYKAHSFGEEFLPSFLPSFLLLCATAIGYYAAEKEDFSDPSKIIAAIPAVIHLSHFSGQERQAGRHCIVNKGWHIYDSHV